MLRHHLHCGFSDSSILLESALKVITPRREYFANPSGHKWFDSPAVGRVLKRLFDEEARNLFGK